VHENNECEEKRGLLTVGGGGTQTPRPEVRGGGMRREVYEGTLSHSLPERKFAEENSPTEEHKVRNGKKRGEGGRSHFFFSKGRGDILIERRTLNLSITAFSREKRRTAL